MRARTLAITAGSTVLVSCAVLSGASDLTVGPDGPPPGEGGERSGDARSSSDAAADVAFADAADAADGDGAASTICDEPGLVARWTFDEGDGGGVRDCTHYHHDGVVAGGTWVAGERDGGMAFDGGWVGFGNPSGLQLVGPLTACAWIRPAVVPAADPTRGYVVSKLASPTGGGWRLAVARNTGAGFPLAAAFNVPDPDGGVHDTKGPSMAVGSWSHVCAVFAGLTQSIFINGTQVSSVATPAGTITPTDDEVRIGVRGDGLEPFAGSVDDVRIYARALDPTEIAALAKP